MSTENGQNAGARGPVRWPLLIAGLAVIPLALAAAGLGMFGDKVAQTFRLDSVALSNASTGQVKPLSLSIKNNTITVAGKTDGDTSRQRILTAAKDAARGRTVVDSVTAESTDRLPGDSAKTAALIKNVLAEDTGGVGFEWTEQGITLTGMAYGEAQKQRLVHAAQEADAGAVSDKLAVSPYYDGKTVNTAALAADLGALFNTAGVKGITYNMGTRTLAGPGAELQQKMADMLRAAPGASVTLIAHAWIGETKDMTCELLAGQRGEDLRNYLISQGVAADKIANRVIGDTNWKKDQAPGPETAVQVA
ncbi:hypothetical protein D5S17_33440 [Pseudonocardiaceae bacterium YIM PH 21723]|nr:hypothetical protein D5S17_33440 [Pseudonocardiaceae bacterium YIM PH 21723]